MKLKQILSVIIAASLIAVQCSAVFAYNGENAEVDFAEQTEFTPNNNDEFFDNTQHETGKIFPTEEEQQYIDEAVPHIVDVKLNSLAQTRLNNYYNEQNIPHLFAEQNTVEMGEEFITNKDEQADTVQTYASTSTIFPATLDNSTRNSFDPIDKPNCFPPIGDQGESGSCAAWSTAYYSLTNNLCVLRGVDAQNDQGEMIKENVISPSWAYNLFNDGREGTPDLIGPSGVIYAYGGAPWSDVDGKTTSTNNLSWYPNETDKPIWRNALKNRALVYEGNYSYWDVATPILPDDTTKLNQLKTILLNGYIVSFDTYIRSFVYKDSVPTDTRPSEKVCVTVNGSNGGHAMTVVGWDDNIEVQVGNVTLKGAVKIVNSWGNTYKNNGFIWMSYDALNKISAYDEINKLYPLKKYAGMVFNSYYFYKPLDYQPLLTADISFKTNHRNKINFQQIGISDINCTEPQTYINTGTLDYISPTGNSGYTSAVMPFSRNTGGDYNFAGGTDLKEDEITYDFTSLLREYIKKHPLIKNQQFKIYLKLTGDDIDISELTGFKLRDEITGNIYEINQDILPMKLPTPPESYNYCVVVDFINSCEQLTSEQPIEIEFDTPIQAITTDNSNIVLKHINGKKVLDSYQLSDDNKTLTVYPDYDKCTKGGLYYLDITAIDQNNQVQNQKRSFYIQGNTEQDTAYSLGTIYEAEEKQIASELSHNEDSGYYSIQAGFDGMLNFYLKDYDTNTNIQMKVIRENGQTYTADINGGEQSVGLDNIRSGETCYISVSGGMSKYNLEVYGEYSKDIKFINPDTFNLSEWNDTTGRGTSSMSEDGLYMVFDSSVTDDSIPSYYEYKYNLQNKKLQGRFGLDFDIKFSQDNMELQLREVRNNSATGYTMGSRLRKNGKYIEYFSEGQTVKLLNTDGSWLTVEDIDKIYHIKLLLNTDKNTQSLYLYEKTSNTLLGKVENIPLYAPVEYINSIGFSSSNTLLVGKSIMGTQFGLQSIEIEGVLNPISVGSSTQYQVSGIGELGDKCMNVDCIWSIEPPIDGIEINSDTGELTISDIVIVDRFTIKAVNKRDVKMYDTYIVELIHPDAYEPNNAIEQASNIQTILGESYNYNILGTIHSQVDHDWYAIQSTEEKYLQLGLLNIGDKCNFTLEICDESGHIYSVTTYQDGTDNYITNFSMQPNKKYYIHIFPQKDSTAGAYTLVASMLDVNSDLFDVGKIKANTSIDLVGSLTGSQQSDAPPVIYTRSYTVEADATGEINFYIDSSQVSSISKVELCSSNKTINMIKSLRPDNRGEYYSDSVFLSKGEKATLVIHGTADVFHLKINQFQDGLKLLNNTFEDGDLTAWKETYGVEGRGLKTIKTEVNHDNHYMELSPTGSDYYNFDCLHEDLSGSIIFKTDVKFTSNGMEIQMRDVINEHSATGYTMGARVRKNAYYIEYFVDGKATKLLNPQGGWLQLKDVDKWYTIQMKIDTDTKQQSIYLTERDTNNLVGKIENVALAGDVNKINWIAISSTDVLGVDNTQISKPIKQKVTLNCQESKYVLEWDVLFPCEQYTIMINDQLIETTDTSYTFYENDILIPRLYNIKIKASNVLNSTYEEWMQIGVKLQHYGDMNGDGYIDSKDVFILTNYIERGYELTKEQKILADVNNDNIINADDSNLLHEYILRGTAFPVGKTAVFYYNDLWQTPSKVITYQYGDVNQDGIINIFDSTQITQYMLGNIELTSAQKILADVNGDDLITKTDTGLIEAYLVDEIAEFLVGNTAFFI